MTTARQIAAALARDLAAAPGLNGALPTLPRAIVALDALGALPPDPALEALPRVVVRPASTAGLCRAEAREDAVEIVCSVQTTPLDGGNPLASAPDDSGVWRCLDGDALDALVTAVLEVIDAASPGAVIADESVEWDYDTAPRQTATITATFQQISTF